MAARHTTELQALLVDSGFEGEVYPQELMARHTSYRIGGPARFYVQVETLSALRTLVDICERTEIAWMLVGKGSNLLVSDTGFDGVIISLGRDFKVFRYDEERHCFIVGAGMSLATLVQEAFKHSLAGLEFAVGTPGTVGGALVMNAGSRDEWIGSRVISITTYSSSRGLRMRKGSEITWGYRKSSFTPDEVVIECEIAVDPAPSSVIRGKMEAKLRLRKKTQPLDYPSCGSVFKNPVSESAGALIEGAGLKGHRVGGAMVSEVHANFIINIDKATADDVNSLITFVQTKVKDKYGIELQPEVKRIGFA